MSQEDRAPALVVIGWKAAGLNRVLWWSTGPPDIAWDVSELKWAFCLNGELRRLEDVTLGELAEVGNG